MAAAALDSSIRLPTCTDNGLFTQMQCDDVTHECFCVDQTTGERIGETFGMASELSCEAPATTTTVPTSGRDVMYSLFIAHPTCRCLGQNEVNKIKIKLHLQPASNRSSLRSKWAPTCHSATRTARLREYNVMVRSLRRATLSKKNS